MKTEMNTVKVRKTEELEAEQLGAHIGEIVRLHGSIYKIRKMSSFAFVLLRTKRQMVQCVYEPAYARFALEKLKEEACVRFTAEVIREERSRSGYDLHLLEVEILSEPEEVPPVVINQKRVNTSIENLLDYRPITLRNEKERAVFQIQARICQAFREFLDGQHFTEIHTPKLVAAGAEGGGRRIEQALKLCGILFVHNHEPIFQNADDAVLGTIDLGDVLILEGGFDHAVGTGVDHGRGTAGLTDDRCTDQGFLRGHGITSKSRYDEVCVKDFSPIAIIPYEARLCKEFITAV